MSLAFLPEAKGELLEAVEYYDAKGQGLGLRFRNEIVRVCAGIVSDPLLWRERWAGYRRVHCPVFPYYVSYVLRGKRIVVVALVHGHRGPGAWNEDVA